MRDYNNELEDILENKSFSVEVKNILLSMFYKINVSYNDYATVKRNVEEKKNYIENLLKVIESCKEIKLIKTTEDIDNIYNQYSVDKFKRKISVYPNEKTMLNALSDLDYTKMFLNDDYKLIKNSLPELINKGKEIDNTEVIRDFDAWSWNTQIDEIQSLEINLVYQNIQLLLGYKKLNELLNLKAVKSDFGLFEDSFRYLYGKAEADTLLLSIYKLAIILYINNNAEERKRLFEEKKWIENEYNRLNNKNKLIEDISKSKKLIMQRIKEIDLILNNKELLAEEYKKRNENLAKHSKISSLNHFKEILLRERNKELEKIEQYNKIIEPQNYTSIKLKFEKDLELLSNIKLDGKIKNPVTKYLLKLQDNFLECFYTQIEKANTKKEIIYLAYALRYYNYIPFNKTQCIKDVKELHAKLVATENKIIEKMYAFKVVNKNVELNIIENIFHTKIISLENIQFELKMEKDKGILIFYDEDTIAETREIYVNDIDFKKIKLNKKIKLFS